MAPLRRSQRIRDRHPPQVQRPTPLRELDTTATNQRSQDQVALEQPVSIPTADHTDEIENLDLSKIEDCIKYCQQTGKFPWSEPNAGSRHPSPSNVDPLKELMGSDYGKMGTQDLYDLFTSSPSGSQKLPDTQILPPESNVQQSHKVFDFSATGTSPLRTSSLNPRPITSPGPWDFHTPSHLSRTTTENRTGQAPSTRDGNDLSSKQVAPIATMDPGTVELSPYNIRNCVTPPPPDKGVVKTTTLLKGSDITAKRRRQRAKTPIQFDSVTGAALPRPKKIRAANKKINTGTQRQAKARHPKKVPTRPSTQKSQSQVMTTSMDELCLEEPSRIEPPLTTPQRGTGDTASLDPTSRSTLPIVRGKKKAPNKGTSSSKPSGIQGDATRGPSGTPAAVVPSSKSPGKHPATALVIGSSSEDSSLSDNEEYYPSPQLARTRSDVPSTAPPAQDQDKAPRQKTPLAAQRKLLPVQRTPLPTQKKTFSREKTAPPTSSEALRQSANEVGVDKSVIPWRGAPTTSSPKGSGAVYDGIELSYPKGYNNPYDIFARGAAANKSIHDSQQDSIRSRDLYSGPKLQHSKDIAQGISHAKPKGDVNQDDIIARFLAARDFLFSTCQQDSTQSLSVQSGTQLQGSEQVYKGVSQAEPKDDINQGDIVARCLAAKDFLYSTCQQDDTPSNNINNHPEHQSSGQIWEGIPHTKSKDNIKQDDIVARFLAARDFLLSSQQDGTRSLDVHGGPKESQPTVSRNLLQHEPRTENHASHMQIPISSRGGRRHFSVTERGSPERHSAPLPYNPQTHNRQINMAYPPQDSHSQEPPHDFAKFREICLGLDANASPPSLTKSSEDDGKKRASPQGSQGEAADPPTTLSGLVTEVR
ncbi:hypothetical protein N3K66_000288 [Trichothecium roseum]|uniref:Uncharacterized protein n=1 Tax=Trichothecium roseum TaxID=47278 RepID=A0ACC0VBI2_9HYPO|nr:hypothetical protein N3K66_000288 [Trichothecium roseum]